MSNNVKIDVFLGETTLTLKEIENFERGSIIDLGIPAGENVKCYHNNVFLFNAEVMVFEKNLAVRINGNIKEDKSRHSSFEKNILPSVFLNKNNRSNVNEKINNEGDSKIEQSQLFSYLSKIKSKDISEFIMSEHPQIIALILSYMNPELAADTLKIFSEEVRTEVLMRISKIGVISPSVVKKVSSVLERRMKTFFSNKVDIGGIDKVVQILNNLNTEESELMIKNINQFDLNLSESIKEKIVDKN